MYAVYIKILLGGFVKKVLLLVIVVMLPGCASGPKYQKLVDATVPVEAKIGLIEQTSCIFTCTDKLSPGLYTEALHARLEKKLNKPILLIKKPADFDWSDEKTILLGKAEGVDYVISGRLDSYIDPSNSSRGTAAAISAVSAVTTVVLGAGVFTSVTPSVSSDIRVFRVADGRKIGIYDAAEKGGSLSSCTTLTENIADVVVDKQFNTN